MFEERMDFKYNDDTEYSERTRRSNESERLISIAKENNLFITQEELESLGEKYPKKTGESVVFIKGENGIVYKVKDPYAKAAIKHGVNPEDVIYEHIVHNFP